MEVIEYEKRVRMYLGYLRSQPILYIQRTNSITRISEYATLNISKKQYADMYKNAFGGEVNAEKKTH